MSILYIQAFRVREKNLVGWKDGSPKVNWHSDRLCSLFSQWGLPACACVVLAKLSREVIAQLTGAAKGRLH